MNKNTIVTYIAADRSVTFESNANSVLWVTDISGVSSNNITISETQGAEQIGSTITSSSIQARDITVNGAVLADVENNRQGILATILPGVQGRLVISQNGGSWYIDGTPTQTPVFSDGTPVQQFQFTLRCPYPYFRNTIDGSVQIAGLTKMFRFPTSLGGKWYISKYSDSLFAVVENTGTAATEFDVIFTATAQVINPEFFHVEKGSYIRIEKTMAEGETITVSTAYGRKGIEIKQADGTMINGFRYLDMGSDLNLKLDPGNNTIRCDADSNREGLHVHIIMPKGVRVGL